jgi:hypothetical protein
MTTRNTAQSGAPALHFDEIETVQQMSPQAAREAISWRIELNMRETGHPFHHQTASGTVVNADPTLDALVAQLTDARSAVPVIHGWYQTDAGISFLYTRVHQLQQM